MVEHQKYSNKPVCKPVSFVGTGLQTGALANITLKTGIDHQAVYFVRKEIDPAGLLIDTSLNDLANFTLPDAIIRQYGVTERAIKQLKTVLRASHNSHVSINVDQAEISVVEGSSRVFARTILGVTDKYLNTSEHGGWIKRPIAVTLGDECEILLPHPVPLISMFIECVGTIIFLKCYSNKMQNDEHYGMPALTLS